MSFLVFIFKISLMAEIPTLLQLTNDTNNRDSLLLEIIKTAIAAGIEAATTAEIQYLYLYDINATLLANSAGPLQQTRLIAETIQMLLDKSYSAFMNSSVPPLLQISWTINAQTSSI